MREPPTIAERAKELHAARWAECDGKGEPCDECWRAAHEEDEGRREDAIERSRETLAEVSLWRGGPY